jgi:RNA polymerase sigma factor (sigma-70 family)
VGRAETEAEWAVLMTAAIDGDDAAYQRLLTSLAGSLRGLVRRGCQRAGRPTADVEDVVQETLLAIHLKRHTWEPGRPIGPWVSAIARNKLVDSLRRQGRRVEVALDDLGAELQADEATVDATGPQIDRMLETLSHGQRDVVRAISLDGTSIGDTAARLNMTEGAVRVALHRGLKALAAACRGDGR